MTMDSIRVFLQRLPLGQRIAAGYKIVACLMLVCGLSGGLGIWKLGSLLTFITGPAWDSADGAMEGSIEIEAQMIAARNILDGRSLEENQRKLANAKENGLAAFKRMTDAGLLSPDRCDDLDQWLEKYNGILADLLETHEQFGVARKEFETASVRMSRLQQVIADTCGLDSVVKHSEIMPLVSPTSTLNDRSRVETIFIMMKLAHLQQLHEVSQLFADAEYQGDEENLRIAKECFAKATHEILSMGVLDSVIHDENLEPELHDMLLSNAVRLRSEQFNSRVGTVTSIFRKRQAQSQLYDSTASEFLEFVAVLEDEADGLVENTSRSITVSKAASATAILVSIAMGLLVAVFAARLCTLSVTQPITAAVDIVQEHTQSNASAVEEMLASIQSIGRNTETAASTSRSAAQVAQRGVLSVQKLGSAASEIGSVVELIKSIAEKTNLLALNATIESARAGDAGRGFAVVANEVKELAKQTASATGSIHQKIQDVCDISLSTASDISEIHDVIVKVDEINQQIRAAVEQQNFTTLEISQSVQATSSAAQAMAVAVG